MQDEGNTVEWLELQLQPKGEVRIWIDRGRPKEQQCLFEARYSVEFLVKAYYSAEISNINFEKVVKILSQLSKSQQGQIDFGSFLKEVKKYLDEPKNIKELGYRLDRKQPIEIFSFIQKIIIKHFLCFLSYLWQRFGILPLLETLNLRKHDIIVRLSNTQELIALHLHLKYSSWTLESPSSKLSPDSRGSHSQPFDKQKSSNTQNKNQCMDVFKEYLNRLLCSEGSIRILPRQTHNFLLLYKDKKLGEGGFGVVMQAESVTYQEGKFQEQVWAVKQIKHNERQSSFETDREYYMLSRLKQLPSFRSNKISKNIIDTDGLIVDNHKKYIIFEHCPFKDLSRFLHHSNSQYLSKINKKHIFIIIYNLISTLYFIHYELIKKTYDYYILDGIAEDKEEIGEKNIRAEVQKGIIHRDLKPNNIMVKQFSPYSVIIKVIDWAFSKRTLTEERIISLRCGTESYQAPEFDRKGEKYCCKIDVWALGVTIYFLLAGKSLTSKDQRKRSGEYKKIFKDKVSKMQFTPQRQFSQAQKNMYQTILINCFEEQPERRWSSKQLFKFIDSNKPYRPLTPPDTKNFYQLRALRVNYTQTANEIMKYQSKKLIRSAILDMTVTFSELYSQLIEEVMEQYFIEDEKFYKTFCEDLQQQKNIFRKDNSTEGNRNNLWRSHPEAVYQYFKKSYKTCEIIEKASHQKAANRLKCILMQLERRWKEKQQTNNKCKQ